MYQAIATEKSALYAEMNVLVDRQCRGENVLAEIDTVKSKLMEIEMKRVRNLEMKIKDQTLMEGEKLSVFQVAKQMKKPPAAGFRLRSGETVLKDVSSNVKHIYEHFSKQFSIGEKQSGCDEVVDPIQLI